MVRKTARPRNFAFKTTATAKPKTNCRVTAPNTYTIEFFSESQKTGSFTIWT